MWFSLLWTFLYSFCRDIDGNWTNTNPTSIHYSTSWHDDRLYQDVNPFSLIPKTSSSIIMNHLTYWFFTWYIDAYRQLKSHFDTPGSAEAECLNELTLGMTKKQAACLFYQTCGMHISFISFTLHCSSEKLPSFQLFLLETINTCSILCAVLATRDFIKVKQELPYGNILISRGAKMWPRKSRRC